MKKLTAFCATLLVAGVMLVQAGEPEKKAGSPEFERMKALVGTWKGTADVGQGPVEMTVQYRLLAGGTVLEERTFPGEPHEMVTMYYEKDGKLALTHYCVMGNRPAMVLDSAEGKTLKFAFDKSCGINTSTEPHMHALKLTFEDANTLTASCRAFMGGKELPEKPTTLKRVKA
jgi:hypothetical protein